MRTLLINGAVFTGLTDHVEKNIAVLIEGDRISAVDLQSQLIIFVSGYSPD